MKQHEQEMSTSFSLSETGEQTFTTRSQIPVYCYPNPHLHSFCLCLYVRAGAIFEKEDEHGITHFFEHIAFKNINHLEDGMLFRKLDRMGLMFNGCTYKEFVQFYLTGASAHFQDAAKLLTRIFEPLSISSEEIDTERRRVKSELRESDEMNSLDYFTQKLIWQDSGPSGNICGTCQSLDKIGARALRRAFRELLSANNIFFYVTGRYTREDILYLAELIDSYKPPVTMELRENVVAQPADFFKRNAMIRAKSADYYYLRLSFDVDTSRYTEAENSLFYDMLFEGETSRIHQALSEKTGYVYSFGHQYERYNNLGNLSLDYEVRPADLYQSLEEAVKVFNDVKHSITLDDLTYVLPEYTDNAELLMDDAEGFNWNRAYECHILSEDYKTVEDRKAAYLGVKTERIMQMARDIFKTENLIFTYKAPKGKVDEERILAILSGLDFE